MPGDYDISEKDKTHGPSKLRTVESLRLNVQAALAGQTWLLLPEGFRDQASGAKYPLPSIRLELQKVAIIPTLTARKTDSGCIYIRRCVRALQKKLRASNSAIIDVGRRREAAEHATRDYKKALEAFKAEAHEAVEGVRRQAEQAIASLNDLFSLGRKGIEAQMRAHLDGNEWQGEKIDARAFRECFRMVSQAVKSLGLPSDQRDAAREAVIDEVSAALKATQEAIAMAPGGDETKH